MNSKMTVTLTYIFGVVFVLVGLLGFLMNPVLGLFEVNTLHNLVHLLSGVALLAGGYMGAKKAKMASLVVGAVYGLVTLLGFVMLGFGTSGSTDLLGFLHINAMDNYLHLVLTVGLLAVGLLGMDEGGSSM